MTVTVFFKFWMIPCYINIIVTSFVNKLLQNGEEDKLVITILQQIRILRPHVFSENFHVRHGNLKDWRPFWESLIALDRQADSGIPRTVRGNENIEKVLYLVLVRNSGQTGNSSQKARNCTRPRHFSTVNEIVKKHRRSKYFKTCKPTELAAAPKRARQLSAQGFC